MSSPKVQLSLFAGAPSQEMMQSSSTRREYVDPFLEYCREYIANNGPCPLKLDADTWDHSIRSAVGLDVESYINFFVICFKRFNDGTRLAFELSERSSLNKDLISSVLRNNVIITFNGTTYDLPIVAMALAGADTIKLKEASNSLVFGEIRPWEVASKFNITLPTTNHIDLIEPNPSVRQGLKMLHGRLHGRYIVDLPYPHDAKLTHEQMDVATLYCQNDIDATEGLYRALREPLQLRSALGKIYGIDLRSKSDSQVGETIVKRRVQATVGAKIERVAVPQSFEYPVPEFIEFQDKRMIEIVEKLGQTTFHVGGTGKILTPPLLEKLQIKIGNMTYAMGIGGLHSTEAHRAVLSDERRFILDVDVASQYPNIIMLLGLFPPSMGKHFLTVYGELIRDRLAAKAEMLEAEKAMISLDKTTKEYIGFRAKYENAKVRADGGRVALNGVYGKLGSPYSLLYAPNLVVAITLTGQLAILMLIERAEMAGIPVISANTDGVVFYCPRSKEPFLNNIIAAWEKDTGFSTEKNPYAAIYNSSVNTYIAIREDGKVKRKGAIADPWSESDLRSQMMKNPQMTVCSAAVVRYLQDGVPLESTIKKCRDPRAFVTVVKVATGALWRGHPLGRAVRFFWCLDGSPIYYSDGKRKVSKTDGSRPLPELTDYLPQDIDYLRYCQEAYRLAVDLGVMI